jgi:hypothetical protein
MWHVVPPSYLHARLPLLGVVRDVQQVSEALVGDELVARGHDARVAPGRRVRLLLLALQPALLLQDFLSE